MKCLNNSDIQQFIDKELPIDELKVIEIHLQHCLECKAKLNIAQIEKNQVFTLLDALMLSEKQVDIPPFSPVIKSPGKKRLYAIISIAASILIFSAIGSFYKQKEKSTEQLNNTLKASYELTKNMDANKMVQQKQIIMVVTDNSGEVIETSVSE